MTSILNKLEPQALWQHFENLNAIPRASKKEEQVIEFMLQFGHSLGLETMKDNVGNVIVKKPASPGMESKTNLVLQSHLDMVHQKNANTFGPNIRGAHSPDEKVQITSVQKFWKYLLATLANIPAA